MNGNRLAHSELSVFEPEKVFDKMKSELKPFFDNQRSSTYELPSIQTSSVLEVTNMYSPLKVGYL